jgi:hypothetical protein
MREQIPIAQPGERLMVVCVEEDEFEKKLLQVVGSRPPAFRKIDVDREPNLRINGYPTQLMWLPEAGGALVAVQDREEAIGFQTLRPGTEVELVSYSK